MFLKRNPRATKCLWHKADYLVREPDFPVFSQNRAECGRAGCSLGWELTLWREAGPSELKFSSAAHFLQQAKGG